MDTRRGDPHGSGLGRVRRAVEWTIGWLKGLRRTGVRCDRLGVIQEPGTTVAASVICYRIWHRDLAIVA